MTFIHDTAIIDNDVMIGKNVSIWHFSHVLSGTSIGDNCTFGQKCYDRTKSQNRKWM